MSKLVETFEEYTGEDESYVGKSDWHSVYTIQLGELIEIGVFSWDNPLLDWSAAAYDEAQY